MLIVRDQNDHQRQNAFIFYQLVNLFLREIYGDQCGDFVCGSVI